MFLCFIAYRVSCSTYGLIRESPLHLVEVENGDCADVPLFRRAEKEVLYDACEEWQALLWSASSGGINRGN